jgi:hypothetical protein
MPSIKRSDYVGIPRDVISAPSTVSVAPEHFVSSTVVKVPRVSVLKVEYVRLTASVTNLCSGQATHVICQWPR